MSETVSPAREEVVAAIRNAFVGVHLGSARSIRQAEEIAMADEPRRRRAGSAALPPEAGDDWLSIPANELDRDGHAYLDAQGLRFYLPALMLRLLDDYRPSRDWAIGTILALDQRVAHPPGFLELLSDQQRQAIAVFVRAAPDLIDLSHEDDARLRRAFRDVWSRYLPQAPRTPASSGPPGAGS